MEHFGRRGDARAPRNADRDLCRRTTFATLKKDQATGRKNQRAQPEQLHRLRIQVKKARYATEFFSGLFHGKKSAKQCKKIKSSLTQLQNCLGKINDIVTHKALFADIIASRARGLTEEQNRHRAFAAGLIIGDQQAQVRNCSIARARRIRASRAPNHSGSCPAGLARRPR